MRTSALRIGILGAARIAPMALIRPARDTDGVSVTAVAARDRGRAEEFARKQGIEKVHDDYESLLADPEVDAIYNPLPNNLHAEWTLRALDAGKHVLCEKPFTSNASEAERVHQAAEQSDRVVMEAFHYRYHPMAQRLRDLVASGDLGKPRFIETWMCIPLPLPRDIRYRLDLAGGATMDTGCYAIHLARTILGEEPVVMSARAKLASEGVDRAMVADVRFPSGAEGRINCSLWSWKVAKIAAVVKLDGGEIRALNPIVPQLFHSLKWRETGGSWNKEKFPKKATYAYQLEAFRDAVVDAKPFITTTAEAVKTMQVVDAVYRAAGMDPRT
ncbi:MAG: gfo/Idh/MocA family oxidoreductase [Deltaproteobacteria bacterium]|nr:Gfo/Idh/MocA family oxidoreductase [Deltaproteobacteria bacterium]MBW1874341.1 Gfo/Idh/MocA family oxidoreductase [Deltaproteobacteria bacterium]MBW2213231.1 Gfo/Idh/MocA family oxidoreductase [Deltaproteobacteria bacterium]MBW2378566.1 Gfo/Idh/MocA family oxidoreductase [Deltaproteobacteria bacterium]MBW2549627.1 Gfo/Idh/MocA family oxidoreductase [Deltaproteobacteria bacterium]